MSAGTLTFTHNSAAVSGNGTAFSTELTAGDFIVTMVGGVAYTLPVLSVASDTALTLVSNYTGPTQAGAAWNAVPRVALNMVTAALVTQAAEALRGINYDKQNWQSVFTGTGTITVTLPDGSIYSGPSWKYLADSMATKVNGAVPITQGGTGATTAEGSRKNLGLGSSATRNIGSTAGTVAEGDDTRLNTVDGKSGGTIKGTIKSTNSVYSAKGGGLGVGASGEGNWRTEINAVTTEPSASGSLLAWYRVWWYSDWAMLGVRRGVSTDVQSFAMTFGGSSGAFVFGSNGNATASGTWTNSSDERLKTNIQRIEDPLTKMKLIKGCTWERRDGATPGIGFIAQDIEKIFPNAVYEGEDVTLEDGSIIEKARSVDVSGVSAALHHEAILAILKRVEVLEKSMLSAD